MGRIKSGVGFMQCQLSKKFLAGFCLMAAKECYDREVVVSGRAGEYLVDVKWSELSSLTLRSVDTRLGYKQFLDLSYRRLRHYALRTRTSLISLCPAYQNVTLINVYNTLVHQQPIN